eukprot:CAMPEP_0168512732 /NCGR_PEP_ID=MMETSP0405-20121227/2992_1 /TAXON_ID=498012 /ORGANISM="Trichosphaerium sp, Strain Am-I-7 wt" /LENGTH=112 /DNA_ID=CAMNT_0008531329 /DNA_START=347 /DNA_END=685 /DNA_ORIENTATION=-
MRKATEVPIIEPPITGRVQSNGSALCCTVGMTLEEEAASPTPTSASESVVPNDSLFSVFLPLCTKRRKNPENMPKQNATAEIWPRNRPTTPGPGHNPANAHPHPNNIAPNKS